MKLKVFYYHQGESKTKPLAIENNGLSIDLTLATENNGPSIDWKLAIENNGPSIDLTLATENNGPSIDHNVVFNPRKTELLERRKAPTRIFVPIDWKIIIITL